MKITNHLNLPLPLVRAVSVEREPHPPMTVSVTTLIQPPQITGLRHLHEDELSEDASDRLWALMGQLLHDILAKHADGTQELAHKRLNIQIDDWTVTGEYDLTEFILEGNKLTDWKFTSIYALKEDEPVKPEWEAQVNAYVELLRQGGESVSEARIIAIGRDWSKRRAERERDYPQKAVLVKPVELWGQDKTLSYLAKRVKLYKNALMGQWPECSEEERWARPTQYALMKHGNKRATRLFDTYDAAERQRGSAYYVQQRPGESVRCASYCAVSSACPQWTKLNQNNNQTKGEENQ